MEELVERVAVVTGAASGIGRALARRFASAGMRLMLADVESDALEAVALELAGDGHQVRSLRVDVSSWEEVAALADAAYETFGAVHLLCNNAGVQTGGRIWDLSLEDWRWVIDVDLWSVVHGIKAFVPRMLAGGEQGHVVNTASTAGLFAYVGAAPYNVAKVGVVALSETLHHELRAAEARIGVSVLCPGIVATRLGESERNRPGGPGEARTPGRWAEVVSRPTAKTPGEIADRVHDAIVGDEFWIITHDGYQPLLQDRYDAILARRVPSPGATL